ncbi:MAG TPA: hypothetical protein VKI44_01150 [Acetobacteraceae bacterium]|nr:hypothetical protein [Acetobacteraceae bacterium]
MTEKTPGTADETVARTGKPMSVRLPGFIQGDEIGLGDAIKRVTYAFGIGPCGGCERRAAALNRWMVLTR